MQRTRLLSDPELVEIAIGVNLEMPIERLRTEGARTLRCRGADLSARRLEAVLELMRRLARVPLHRGQAIDSACGVADRMRERYRDACREEFVVVLLDGRNRVIAEYVVARGTSGECPVVPRDVLVEAIRESASGVIFVHNHPSGDPLPSREDVLTTRRLRQTCALIGLTFVDHLIVSDEGHFSFVEEGMA